MFEAGLDQASGLRRLFRSRSMRLLPLAADPHPEESAGLALNLAAALARNGNNPIVLDGHRHGVAELLGLEVRHELLDLIEGRCPVAQAVRRSGDGLAVLPAWRGLGALADDPQAAEAVFSALASLHGAFDVALVHAPAELLGPLLSAQPAETALLCGPEEDDLAQAYAQVKTMVQNHRMSHFRVIFGGIRSQALAVARHQRLASVAARFLDAAVAFGGAVGREPDDGRSSQERARVFGVAAQGPAARAFERIAAAAHDWRLPAFSPDRRTIH